MLGVSKPSVSHAMKLLREDGYIAMDRYGTVTLLEKGNDIAVQMCIRDSPEGIWLCADTGNMGIYETSEHRTG